MVNCSDIDSPCGSLTCTRIVLMSASSKSNMPAVISVPFSSSTNRELSLSPSPRTREKINSSSSRSMALNCVTTVPISRFSATLGTPVVLRSVGASFSNWSRMITSKLADTAPPFPSSALTRMDWAFSSSKSNTLAVTNAPSSERVNFSFPSSPGPRMKENAKVSPSSSIADNCPTAVPTGWFS